MKDVKTIFILVLLGFCLFFFSLWYFKGTGYKKEYKRLEIEFKKLQNNRDSLYLINNKLEKEYNSLEKKIKLREIYISKLESDIEKTKLELRSAKSEVSRFKSEWVLTKKRIEDLKKNPIKREDDQLIKSLKEKLKN
jgi:chromosome segregation ATPase